MPESNLKESVEQIQTRIKPLLDARSVDSLAAWLKTVSLPSSKSRPVIEELIAKSIASGDLVESALERALIGFEESSDMRILLFTLEDVKPGKADKWMPSILSEWSIPLKQQPVFGKGQVRPMTPVYGVIEGNQVRIKWTEQHEFKKLKRGGDGIDSTPRQRFAVLIADLDARIAELRINPAETAHGHRNDQGEPVDELYYDAYLRRAKEILQCMLQPVELRTVIKALVSEENPRVVRIHINQHANQKNGQHTINAAHGDVRDDPDFMLMYGNSPSWAWGSASFYWRPEVSSGFLKREIFSKLNAVDGYVKVNADCSDEEVNYVVGQIRAR